MQDVSLALGRLDDVMGRSKEHLRDPSPGRRALLLGGLEIDRGELDFEERMRRREASLVQRLDQMADGVLIHRGLRYLYANPAALKLLGRTYDEVVGHSPFDLVPPRFRLLLAERIMDAYTTRAPMPEEEERLLHATGAEIPVEVVTLPVVFAGELATLVHIRNLTARRGLEVKLRASDRLASAGVVAAGVAHEIESPLLYALSNLELLEDRLERSEDAEKLAEVRAMVAAIHASVARAAKGAEDAKVFTSAQRNRRTRVDINRVLDSCLAFLGPEMCSRVNVVRRYGDVPPVLGNTSRLAHVIMNLLKNAAQAMSPRVRCANDVTITTSTRGDSVVLVEIADTGVGLSLGLQRAIFEPLFTTKSHGMGMGLAVSRALLEEEEGELTVESQIGSGTTFTVALRAAPRVEAPERPRGRSTGKRILVLEEEAQFAATLKMTLSEHRVTIVKSGHEALRRLHSGETYDLVLCDLMLDNADGIDLHRRIRAEWPDLQRRMVFLTGDAFMSRTQEFLASIPNPSLRKPFEPVELLDLVDDALEACGTSATTCA